MKRNKLNFEEISQSMEVLDRDSQRAVKGGLSAAELLADILRNGIGNHAGKSYAFDGGQNGFSYISNTYYGGILPEVVVTATPTGDGCLNCLNPSTIGKNFGLTYPGPFNPLSFNGDFNYSYVPKSLAEYPAIGHDRRYDNLEISGGLGLFTDTRAIGADWQFVFEELSIAANPSINSIDRNLALFYAFTLGAIALPKTLFQLSTPNGISQINTWYNISNQGVNNAPAIHEH